MPRYGPPDEFNRQPTQYADSGTGGYQPSGPPAPTESPTESFAVDDFDAEPAPWYRKPVTLIVWALLVVILIALIVYGIIELIGEGERAGHTPAPTRTTAPTTLAPSATETTTPPPPTTTGAPPTTATGGPAPQQPTGAPPPAQQPTQSPTHHHLPPIPSTITIPGMPNPITLPPNLPH